MWSFLALVAVLIFVGVLSAFPFACIGFLVWVLGYGLGMDEEELVEECPSNEEGELK